MWARTRSERNWLLRTHSGGGEFRHLLLELPQDGLTKFVISVDSRKTLYFCAEQFDIAGTEPVTRVSAVVDDLRQENRKVLP